MNILILVCDYTDEIIIPYNKLQGQLRKLVNMFDVPKDISITCSKDIPLNYSKKFEIVILTESKTNPLEIISIYNLMREKSILAPGKFKKQNLNHFVISKLDNNNLLNILFEAKGFGFLYRKYPNFDKAWSIVLHWSCKQFNIINIHNTLAIIPEKIKVQIKNICKAVSCSMNSKSKAGERAKIILDMIRMTQNMKSIKMLTNCKNIKGLKWTRNSCYMDSGLQCLLAIPSVLNMYLLSVKLKPRMSKCGKTLTKDLQTRIKIQQSLKLITDTLRGKSTSITTADQLRELSKSCNVIPGSPGWWTAATQDSGEFIIWLLSLFPVNKGITVRTSYATNDLSISDTSKMTLTSSNSVINNSPVFNVDHFTLKKAGNVPLTTFLTQIEDSILDKQNLLTVNMNGEKRVFRRSVRITKLFKAPGSIIFNISRGGGMYQGQGEASYWLKTAIEPIQEFTLSSGQVFEFSGVVLYDGIHYTSCYKCNKNWYYYDDMQAEPYKIGDYDTLMSGNLVTRIKTRGTIYFYNQIKGPRGLPTK